ncbi:homeobox protein Mohawk [Macrosteles quadrilineatus]|uniref:homeobox protein Mohawk n=1 Tax=Macrosteles quadrilineatus TaxID=74068 RepID=UPI0023E1877C|nr:homeobox protein Mohawk [Macrosteles quadrilineatus]
MSKSASSSSPSPRGSSSIIVDVKCWLPDDNTPSEWTKDREFHDCKEKKVWDGPIMTKTGRTLRNIKYRKVVENVRCKKQLFTPEIKKVLKEWLVRRRKHPYPSRNEKKELALQTGLTYMQICNWFANWRRKLRQNSPGEGWGHLITGYNHQVRGKSNCEQFSISSRDSIWDETDYKLQHRPLSGSNQESSPTSRVDPINNNDNCWSESLSTEKPVTSALVKWLESAARFRPRLSSSPNLHCWGGCPPLAARKPRRPRGRLRTRGRHREELDAAEALTFLSMSAVHSS